MSANICINHHLALISLYALTEPKNSKKGLSLIWGVMVKTYHPAKTHDSSYHSHLFRMNI